MRKNSKPKTIRGMSYEQAMQVLNACRRGEHIDLNVVMWALELTGDYDPDADFQKLYEGKK